LKLASVALVALAGSRAVAAAPLDPPTAVGLGWPADTATVEVRATRHVLEAARTGAPAIGKIVAGTRVAVLGLHAGDRRCSAWVAIAPRGFLCASDLEPTSAAPGGADLPTVAPGQLLPGAYYDVVADDTPAYRDVAAARDGAPTELLSTHVLVRGGDLVEIDGQDYLPTHRGLVPASELRPLDPSAFVGLDLRAQPAPWPLAFVGPDHDAIVRAAPRRDAPVVGQRAARAVVWVRSERPGWVELGPDAWVAAGELRVVRPAAPPPDLAADAPWLDVDLDQQTLVAYVGATPMYVTLVSTGRRRGTTPPGLYRIVAKAATTRMTAEAHEQNQYDVGAVPWALRFRRGLYLHAAYWHDRFGARKSHGCINLAPRDARALYAWVTPSAPPGWSEVEIPTDRAVVLRIRDAATPAPAWYDYAREGRRGRARRR
jgi:hypothetical protein